MDSNSVPSVLWREGMFLCPHHLQAFSREVESRIRRGDGIGQPGNFGLLSLKLAEEPLARDVFSVEEALLVLPDGTSFACPSIAQVEPREFAEFFTTPELDVFLGISAAVPNVPQVDYQPNKESRLTRYKLRVETVFDETQRDAPRELEFRDLQGRVFFGEEDRTGFDCVQIARLVRRGKPVPRTVLSTTYIPPVLRVAASSALAHALRELAGLVRAQARDLAARVPATSGLSSVERGADFASLFKLLSLNQCVARLDQVAGLPELHPFLAHTALIESIGSLAVFGQERLMPELPVYDHADLDRSFASAIDTLKGLIEIQVAVPYDTVSLVESVDRPGIHGVEVPVEWTVRDTIFYLAIEAKKDAATVVEGVKTGLKLVADSDVERMLRGVIPGIELSHERMPPISFPRRNDLHFFRIHTEGVSREPWLALLKTRKAAILSTLDHLGAVRYHLYVELRG